jgi:hypothetical protein
VASCERSKSSAMDGESDRGRRKEPNQSIVPTTASVTRRAGARHAPDAVAAHL